VTLSFQPPFNDFLAAYQPNDRNKISLELSAINDLVAGTIDAVIDQTVTMIPMHTGGSVTAIATSSAARLAQIPDVPTFAEAGVPAFDLTVWNAIAAPASRCSATDGQLRAYTIVIVSELGLAAIVVTHDLAVARLLSHRVMVMKGGRVIETGLTDQVLDDPREPYTQLLVSSILPA